MHCCMDVVVSSGRACRATVREQERCFCSRCWLVFTHCKAQAGAMDVAREPHVDGSARRRRERRLRTWFRHEQFAIRCGLASAKHHSHMRVASVAMQTDDEVLAATCAATTAPAPVVEYVMSAPAATPDLPVPVIEYVAPASAVTFDEHAPVIDCVAPAHAVTFAAPVPVIEYATPSLVIEHIAQAPSVTLATHSQLWHHRFGDHSCGGLSLGRAVCSHSFPGASGTVHMVEIPVTEIAEEMRLASLVQVQQRTPRRPAAAVLTNSPPRSTQPLNNFLPWKIWLSGWKTSRRRLKNSRSSPSGWWSQNVFHGNAADFPSTCLRSWRKERTHDEVWIVQESATAFLGRYTGAPLPVPRFLRFALDYDDQRARLGRGDQAVLSLFALRRWACHCSSRGAGLSLSAHLRKLHSASHSPSFGWLWSDGTHSLPPQRGRMLGISARTRAALVWMTT